MDVTVLLGAIFSPHFGLQKQLAAAPLFLLGVGVPRSSAICVEAQIGASDSIAAGLVVAKCMLSLTGGGTGQPE